MVKNAADKISIADFRLFGRFKSFQVCTGSKGAEIINILAAEIFLADTS